MKQTTLKTPEYKSLFNYLLNNYKYVEPETTYQWYGSRIVNTKILCWVDLDVYAPSLTVFIQCLKGSNDDLFDYKYIVFVDNKYVGMCGSEDGVFSLVLSLVSKGVDEC